MMAWGLRVLGYVCSHSLCGQLAVPPERGDGQDACERRCSVSPCRQVPISPLSPYRRGSVRAMSHRRRSMPSPEYMSSPVSMPGRDRSPRHSLHLRSESLEASLHPVLRQQLRNRAAAMSPASSPSRRQSAMPVLMSPKRESLNLGTAASRGSVCSPSPCSGNQSPMTNLPWVDAARRASVALLAPPPALSPFGKNGEDLIMKSPSSRNYLESPSDSTVHGRSFELRPTKWWCESEWI